MILYVSIGALAAVGSMYLSHRFVSAKFEAGLYGLFLIAIAAFYLAFASYFGNAGAWSLETAAVFVFALMGCLGTRLPVALIAGYALHGVWDLLHEVHAHAGTDVFGGRGSAQIPLGYGAFCAAYDWAIASYFWFRRRHWMAAWTSQAAQHRRI
jgi:hypothetical protein